MQKLLKNEATSLKEFLAFMRHGWDSIWHLTMLFAAFIVTLASIAAPFVIVAAVLYTIGGSLGAGGSQLAAWSRSEHFAGTSQNSREVWRNDAPSSTESGGWLLRVLSKVTWLLKEGMVLVVSTLVMTPLAIANMMCYLLALDIASATVLPDKKYDLVFDAYGRMLGTARQHWKELLMGGLFLALLWNAAFFGLEMLGRLIGTMGAPMLGLWIAVGLAPVAMGIYLVYANVFLASASLEIRASNSDPESD